MAGTWHIMSLPEISPQSTFHFNSLVYGRQPSPLQMEIVQCKEFTVRSVEKAARQESVHSGFRDPADALRLGICSNCLNVHTCGFPDARRGVLHCEEYVLDEAGGMSPVQTGYSRSAA
ncbi:MAG: hypothetical protein JXR49_07060 [Acidobacteria bacterium]|nr:hypothetical protein [Acidobacteriota bacterium]